MTRRHGICLVLTWVLMATTGKAQDTPPMEDPTKEHEWLQQLTGEWETEAEIKPGPDQPAIKAKGTESNRMLGRFWLVSEGKGNVMGMDINSIMTLGYDAKKKKFVGTWIDSMGSHLWRYEGTLDEAGKVLTLEAEGPSMLDPTKTAKYRDVTEFKSPDHRVFSSSLLGEDGKWVKFLTAEMRKKK